MENDEFLRSEALRQAIAHFARLAGPMYPTDVVSCAQAFYDFLKGETK